MLSIVFGFFVKLLLEFFVLLLHLAHASLVLLLQALSLLDLAKKTLVLDNDGEAGLVQVDRDYVVDV